MKKVHKESQRYDKLKICLYLIIISFIFIEFYSQLHPFGNFTKKKLTKNEKLNILNL